MQVIPPVSMPLVKQQACNHVTADQEENFHSSYCKRTRDAVYELRNAWCQRGETKENEMPDDYAEYGYGAEAIEHVVSSGSRASVEGSLQLPSTKLIFRRSNAVFERVR